MPKRDAADVPGRDDPGRDAADIPPCRPDVPTHRLPVLPTTVTTIADALEGGTPITTVAARLNLTPVELVIACVRWLGEHPSEVSAEEHVRVCTRIAIALDPLDPLGGRAIDQAAANAEMRRIEQAQKAHDDMRRGDDPDGAR